MVVVKWEKLFFLQSQFLIMHQTVVKQVEVETVMKMNALQTSLPQCSYSHAINN